MSAIIRKIVKGPDITNVERVGDSTRYTARISGLTTRGVTLRTKVSEVFDLPPRVPSDVSVETVEHGRIFKTYKVSWTLPVRQSAREMVSSVRKRKRVLRR